MTTIEKVLQSIRYRFKLRLAAKAGWGRNQLIAEYDQAVAEALAAYLWEREIEGRQGRRDNPHVPEDYKARLAPDPDPWDAGAPF